MRFFFGDDDDDGGGGGGACIAQDMRFNKQFIADNKYSHSVNALCLLLTKIVVFSSLLLDGMCAFLCRFA